MKKYYPIMLDIAGRPCTIIGGGKVAERKLLSVLAYGATVKVISPEVTEKIKALAAAGEISYINRSYEAGDLTGSYMVFVATNDMAVSRVCHQEARDGGILINIVDVPALCAFIVPAVVRRGDLTISVSTNGKSPMLTKRLRQQLEEGYGDGYGDYIAAMGEIRRLALSEIADTKEREALFKALVYDDAIRAGLSKSTENQGLDLKALVFDTYMRFKKERGGD